MEVVSMAKAKKNIEATVEATPVVANIEKQSKTSGGIDMTDKYLVCNTSKVKATNAGGRLHSVVLDEEVPNGALVFVGKVKEGETEIREAAIPTAAAISGKVKPMLVMKPEINYSQARKSDAALGIHRNRAGKAVPAIPLEAYDEFELSQDFFVGRQADQIAVGDKFKMTDNSVFYTYSASEVTGDCAYLEVTGVRDAFHAITLMGDDLDNKFPVTYKMVMVEVKFN